MPKTIVQDPNYVIRQVIAMQDVVKNSGVQEEDIEKEFADFKQKCPNIYQKAKSPMSQTDMNILMNMLKKLHDIRQQNVSHHDGSREIGELLVDTFVKPQLRSLDQHT